MHDWFLFPSHDGQLQFVMQYKTPHIGHPLDGVKKNIGYVFPNFGWVIFAIVDNLLYHMPTPYNFFSQAMTVFQACTRPVVTPPP